MPAISPVRLKKDVSELMSHLDDHDVFEHELEHFMEFYADRTIRPSQAGLPASLLPMYHLPRPVLRELTLGLSRYAAVQADEALQLAHRLWFLGVYEAMMLAVKLMRELPDSHSAVVMRNLVNWMQTTEDEQLLSEIFNAAVLRDAKGLLDFIGTLLESKMPTLKTTALSGLTALAIHAPGDVMPAVYRLTGRTIQDQTLDQRVKILALAQALAQRSPAETAFFMRQQYLVSMTPEIGRLLRQCLPFFPEDIRADLRQMLRENR